MTLWWIRGFTVQNIVWIYSECIEKNNLAVIPTNWPCLTIDTPFFISLFRLVSRKLHIEMRYIYFCTHTDWVKPFIRRAAKSVDQDLCWQEERSILLSDLRKWRPQLGGTILSFQSSPLFLLFSIQITTSIYPVPCVNSENQIADWFVSLAECLHWNVRQRQRNLSITDCHVWFFAATN